MPGLFDDLLTEPTPAPVTVPPPSGGGLFDDLDPDAPRRAQADQVVEAMTRARLRRQGVLPLVPQPGHEEDAARNGGNLYDSPQLHELVQAGVLSPDMTPEEIQARTIVALGGHDPRVSPGLALSALTGLSSGTMRLIGQPEQAQRIEEAVASTRAAPNILERGASGAGAAIPLMLTTAAALRGGVNPAIEAAGIGPRGTDALQRLALASLLGGENLREDIQANPAGFTNAPGHTLARAAIEGLTEAAMPGGKEAVLAGRSVAPGLLGAGKELGADLFQEAVLTNPLQEYIARSQLAQAEGVPLEHNADLATGLAEAGGEAVLPSLLLSGGALGAHGIGEHLAAENEAEQRAALAKLAEAFSQDQTQVGLDPVEGVSPATTVAQGPNGELIDVGMERYQPEAPGPMQPIAAGPGGIDLSPEDIAAALAQRSPNLPPVDAGAGTTAIQPLERGEAPVGAETTLQEHVAEQGRQLQALSDMFNQLIAEEGKPAPQLTREKTQPVQTRFALGKRQPFTSSDQLPGGQGSLRDLAAEAVAPRVLSKEQAEAPTPAMGNPVLPAEPTQGIPHAEVTRERPVQGNIEERTGAVEATQEPAGSAGAVGGGGNQQEAPAPAAEAVAKGKPAYQAKVFQGRGGTPEEIYGKEAVAEGRAAPLFGKANYFATTQEEARDFGNDVTEHQVELSNPFILDSDKKWFQLIKDADVHHLNNMGELFYKEPSKIPAAGEKLQAYLKGKGYDGIVVKLGSEGKTKRLASMAGVSQTVVFGEPAAQPAAAPERIESPHKMGEKAVSGEQTPSLEEVVGRQEPLEVPPPLERGKEPGLVPRSKDPAIKNQKGISFNAERQPDVLDAINEIGGIRSKPKGYQGGEYDDKAERYPVAYRVIRKGAGSLPDQVAKDLQDRGIGDGTAPTMWKLIDQAIAARESARTPEERPAPGITTLEREAIEDEGTAAPGDISFSGVQAKQAGAVPAYQAAEEHARFRQDSAGRLMPAPLEGEPAKEVPPLRKSFDDLAEWLGAVVYDRKKLFRRAAGYYQPSSAALVLKQSTDVDVAAHEISHWLDDAFGILGEHQSLEARDTGAEESMAAQYQEATAATFDRELRHFWPYGSNPPRGVSEAQAKNYRRAEGAAEWLRAWYINPKAAEQAAPLFSAQVKAKVPAEVLDRLREFGDDLRRFYHADPLAAGGAVIQRLEDVPSMGDRFTAAWKSLFRTGNVRQPLHFGIRDWLAVRFTDRLAPVLKAMRWAGEEGGPVLADRARRAEMMVRVFGGINDKIGAIARVGMIKANWLENGKIERAEDVEGGLDWLAGWVNTSSAQTILDDMHALNSYMVAQRVIEKSEQIDQARAATLEGMTGRAILEHAEDIKQLKEYAEKARAKAQKQSQRFGTAQKAVEEAGGKVEAAKIQPKRRSDALAKAIERIGEKVSKGQVGLEEDAIKEIERLAKAVDARFDRRLAAIARSQAFMEQRDRIRKSRLSGQGGGLVADDNQAQRIVERVQNDPVLRSRLDVGAKRYRAWANGVLRYLVDKGRLSRKSYDEITAANDQYVAMNRLMDEDGALLRPAGGGKLGVKKDTVKGFKGSQREIANPLANLMENTARSVEEADRNEVMRSIVDSLSQMRGMYEGEPTDLGSVAARVAGPEEGAVTIFRNGEEEHWKFAPEIEAALKGLGEQYRLPLLATALPSLMRLGIVKSPAFALRNRIRDVGQRLVTSEATPDGLGQWLTHLKEQIPGLGKSIDEEKRAITELSGGAFAGHYLRGRESWQKETLKRVKELRKDKNVIVSSLVGAGRAYNKLIENSEFSGRANEFWNVFNQLRSRGVDEQSALLEAAQASRKLVDFAVSGTWVGAMNQIIPFLNAAVQGLRATIGSAKAHPARFATRWATYAALPSVLSYVLASMRGDDDREEYVNLPNWRRDLFWNFKVAPNLWLSIPKPFELGALGTGVERGVEAADRVRRGEKPTEALDKAFDGFGASARKALLPVDESALMPGFKPLVESLVNRDVFTDKNIVPAWEEKLPVKQREGTQYASRLGRFGQWASFNAIDARHVDHLIRGSFGELGGLTATASDLGRADKADTGSRLVKQATGVIRDGAADQQQDVQRFLEEETEAGRPQGKPVKAIADMRKDYWLATTGKERDQIAKAMRDYAEGRDPLMAFDRAVSAANQLEHAMEKLPDEAQPEFMAAHSRELARAKTLSAANRKVSQAKKAGLGPDAVRKIAKDLMANIDRQYPDIAGLGKQPQ